MALQILGGTARGRTLEVPKTARPTGVRVRKSLFDLLEHRYRAGSSFLDLYAGSGAVGLEAASRGYAATLVERDVGAVKALTANASKLNLRAKIVQGDAGAFLARAGQSFDIVFVDPPFTQDLPRIFAQVLEAGRVAPDGTLIVQHPIQLVLQEAEGYLLERRDYGSNTLTFYWRDDAGV